MFFQLDAARIATVYISQGAFVAIFVLLAYKVLKRSRNNMNVVLSCFYLSIAMGFFINFIYALLTDLFLVKVLNAMTNFLVFFGLIFILLFTLLLLKPNAISRVKQIIIVLGYGVLLGLMNVIPNGVTIGPETMWKPVWNIPFFAYILTIVTGICIVPTIYCSLVIFRNFQTEDLKKKWKYFIIGVVGVFFVMYGTMVSNTLNNPSFRTIWAFIGLSAILWGYLLYYGVGRQL